MVDCIISYAMTRIVHLLTDDGVLPAALDTVPQHLTMLLVVPFVSVP